MLEKIEIRVDLMEFEYLEYTWMNGKRIIKRPRSTKAIMMDLYLPSLQAHH
jgi:hypothetical protein